MTDQPDPLRTWVVAFRPLPDPCDSLQTIWGNLADGPRPRTLYLTQAGAAFGATPDVAEAARYTELVAGVLGGVLPAPDDAHLPGVPVEVEAVVVVCERPLRRWLVGAAAASVLALGLAAAPGCPAREVAR